MSFSIELAVALCKIRTYAPGEAPTKDLAAFIGVEPTTVCAWQKGAIHPIQDHYDLICKAIPSLIDFNPDPRLQEKPGRKTGGNRVELPEYFKRAVKARNL